VLKAAVSDFEDGGRESWVKASGQPLETGNAKVMVSVLEPLEKNKACRHHDWD
jgi:hypothetical protein